MFNQHTEKAVTLLLDLELEQAIRQHGRNYENHEQAQEVLKEEIEEVNSELFMLHASFDYWKENGITGRAQDVYKYARTAIKELAQVAAVAQKILNGYGNESEEELLKKWRYN